MKIYILPTEKRFQPLKQIAKYPIHSHDYGVEQDFLKYIKSNNEIITDDINKADWHYLPVFWTRWHINHDYAKEGLKELQENVDQVIIDDSLTFTICQYDDGPVVKLGKTLEFLSSRKGDTGIDIPLLCDPHKLPFFIPKKKYLATFVGRLNTHPIRKLMAECLHPMENILIKNGNFGTRYFVKRTLESYVTLAPRGYGGSSFRFFETMQLGVVPFLIGNNDTRPFKRFINWDDISLFSNAVPNLVELLHSLSKPNLLSMGKNARMIWEEKLTYQKWCQYVIKELEET